MPHNDRSGAVLLNMDLDGADFTGVNLTKANLFQASPSGANLKGAYLTGAVLFEAKLDGVQLDDSTKWPEGFTRPLNTVASSQWRRRLIASGKVIELLTAASVRGLIKPITPLLLQTHPLSQYEQGGKRKNT
jgi:hypothetical protein